MCWIGNRNFGFHSLWTQANVTDMKTIRLRTRYDVPRHVDQLQWCFFHITDQSLKDSAQTLLTDKRLSQIGIRCLSDVHRIRGPFRARKWWIEYRNRYRGIRKRKTAWTDLLQPDQRPTPARLWSICVRTDHLHCNSIYASMREAWDLAGITMQSQAAGSSFVSSFSARNRGIDWRCSMAKCLKFCAIALAII